MPQKSPRPSKLSDPDTPINELAVVLTALEFLDATQRQVILRATLAFYNIGNEELGAAR